MLKKAGIALLILIVIAGGFFFLQMKKNAAGVQSKVTVVSTVTAQPESIQTSVDADGTVKPGKEIEVKVEIAGIIDEVFVEEGSKVEKGSPLLKIDDREIKNSLEAAVLSHAEALRNYQQLVEKMEIQKRQNELRLEEARQNLHLSQVSLENEKAKWEQQKSEFEQLVEEKRIALEKAEEELDNNEFLFKKGAIPQKMVEESKEAYETALRAYENARADLKVLIEETIPNALELAELKVENAENQFEMVKASLQSDAITQEDIRLARLRKEQTAKQVRELEEKLKKATMYSPLTGTVIQVVVKEGDSVLTGNTVFKVGDMSSALIEAMVDEIHVNQVQIGQEVNITSDAFEQEFKGKVVSIAPAATQVGNINKFATKIKVEGGKEVLRPGIFVNAEIVTNFKKSVIAVPPLAVLGEGENRFVYIVEEGKAVRRNVKLGLKNLTRVEIKEGVKPGEEIIIGPYTVLKTLKPGTPVMTQNNKKGALENESE